MKLSFIWPPPKMSWVKKVFLMSAANNKAFLVQLIFGGGQMNDNFIKFVTRSIYYIILREVLRDLLRDVQDATHYI